MCVCVCGGEQKEWRNRTNQLVVKGKIGKVKDETYLDRCKLFNAMQIALTIEANNNRQIIYSEQHATTARYYWPVRQLLLAHHSVLVRFYHLFVIKQMTLCTDHDDDDDDDDDEGTNGEASTQCWLSSVIIIMKTANATCEFIIIRNGMRVPINDNSTIHYWLTIDMNKYGHNGSLLICNWQVATKVWCDSSFSSSPFTILNLSLDFIYSIINIHYTTHTHRHAIKVINQLTMFSLTFVFLWIWAMILYMFKVVVEFRWQCIHWTFHCSTSVVVHQWCRRLIHGIGKIVQWR